MIRVERDRFLYSTICNWNSSQFIEFIKSLDSYNPEKKSIRIILDNHTIHTSAQTREYLKTVPNRFEFIFTPKHASWLNLIETFFSKIARTVLRQFRVHSKEELKNRLRQFIAQINELLVVFRWTQYQEPIDRNSLCRTDTQHIDACSQTRAWWGSCPVFYFLLS